MHTNMHHSSRIATKINKGSVVLFLTLQLERMVIKNEVILSKLVCGIHFLTLYTVYCNCTMMCIFISPHAVNISHMHAKSMIITISSILFSCIHNFPFCFFYFSPFLIATALNLYTYNYILFISGWCLYLYHSVLVPFLSASPCQIKISVSEGNTQVSEARLH